MGEAVNDQVLNAFETLCTKAAEADQVTLGEDELEPLYEEVLEFLTSHPTHRAQLAQSLIDMMGKYRFSRERREKLLPSTAIVYAMHELRWPEILEFAQQENQAFYAPKMETLMNSIIAAYEDDWENKDFYKRFR